MRARRPPAREGLRHDRVRHERRATQRSGRRRAAVECRDWLLRPPRAMQPAGPAAAAMAARALRRARTPVALTCSSELAAFCRCVRLLRLRRRARVALRGRASGGRGGGGRSGAGCVLESLPDTRLVETHPARTAVAAAPGLGRLAAAFARRMRRPIRHARSVSRRGRGPESALSAVAHPPSCCRPPDAAGSGKLHPAPCESSPRRRLAQAPAVRRAFRAGQAEHVGFREASPARNARPATRSVDLLPRGDPESHPPHTRPMLAGVNETVVFRARGLTKVYRMGEVEVHRAARRRPRPVRAASSSCCSGPRAAASRRCSTSSADSTAPTSGEVRLRGPRSRPRQRDASSPRYRRDHVGFVFQFYNLIPSLTARENVALVTEIAATR